MMKKLLLILPLLLLSGCAVMTNEQVVKEKDICVKGGMDYVVSYNSLGENIGVRCVNPNK